MSLRSSPLWANRRFRLLLSAYGLSTVGDAFLPVSLAAGILLAGGSPTDLGIPLAAAVLARLVTTLMGGAAADRWPPVRVMVTANAVRAVANGAMAILFAFGNTDPWALAMAMAVASVGGSFYGPAAVVVKQAIVEPEQRGDANASYSLASNIGATAGPILAGLTVAVLGASVGMFLNALVCVVATLLVVGIRVTRTVEPQQSFLRQLSGGLKVITSRSWLWLGIGSATIYHLAAGVAIVLTQTIAVTQLGGADALGIINASAGFGSVAGALIAMRTRAKRILVSAWLPLAVTSAATVAYVWPGALIPVIVATAFGGVSMVYFGVAWDTYLQNTVPPASIGRVYSWDILSSMAMMPLGNLIAGPLSATLGVGPVLIAASIVMTVFCLTPLLARATWTARWEDRDVADSVDRNQNGQRRVEG